MAAIAAAYALPRRVLSIEKLRRSILWLMGFAGAFVFIEPGPYEIVGALAIAFALLTGLTLRAAHVPLLMILIALNIGYATSVVQVIDQPKLVTWVLISAFLATTALFYASMLGAHTSERLDALMRGCLWAGVVASVVAIAAYFHLMGGVSDTFLLYGRARGTFNDPNVLGAFLVLPGLLVVQRMIAGRLSAFLGGGCILLLLVGALFLSFSRAAWGQFVFGALALMAMTFVTSSSPRDRLRIVVIAIVCAMTAVALVVALLSIGDVASLFKERASLEQSYDLGHLGRFGRYILGFDLMLDRPLGIGPLQFQKVFFPEDPHNTFLNTFMSGGWLSGLAYLTLTLVTVVRGFRFVFLRTPWQATYQVVYAAYLGVAFESTIIDIDHWRHFFLILGVLWGLMAVSRAQAARPDLAPRAAQA